MKRFLQISAITCMVMLFAGLRNTASAQPAGDVSYQTFYDELSPYGRWVDYPEYGYVWAPDAGADFRPYSTNGHWVWSDDYEWMWVSDYSWGWATFHYGRWFYDDLYGWMWSPGYEWSPAWVAWRSGGDYYGWAPLRPGINISYGFSIGSYSPPNNYWCFTPCRYITSPRIYDYCVSPRQNVTIINNTTIINNYNYSRNVFVTGPRRNDAERFTNSRINSVRVREISNPGRAGFRRNEVSIYRPSVQRENNRGFAPRRLDEYRGNNATARNDNRGERRNAINDRSTNRAEERSTERRSIFNERANGNNSADNNNRGRFQQPQRNNIPDQRVNNDEAQARDRRFNGQPIQRNNNVENGARERPARDVFRDNGRGINEPAPRSRFERQEQPDRNNGSFNRNQPSRVEPQQQPVRNNDNFNRREPARDNGNRGFDNAAPRQQRRESFNNRNFNPPQQQQQQPRQQQQRQSFPEINRRQEQPRQFSRPADNNNNNHGAGIRGRRQ